MNEEQLEKAARKLCVLRGIDPDQLISHGAPANEHGFVPAICLWSPSWKLVAGELKDFEQKTLVINQVMFED